MFDLRLFLVLWPLCWAYYVIVEEYDDGILHHLVMMLELYYEECVQVKFYDTALFFWNQLFLIYC